MIKEEISQNFNVMTITKRLQFEKKLQYLLIKVNSCPEDPFFLDYHDRLNKIMENLFDSRNSINFVEFVKDNSIILGFSSILFVLAIIIVIIFVFKRFSRSRSIRYSPYVAPIIENIHEQIG